MYSHQSRSDFLVKNEILRKKFHPVFHSVSRRFRGRFGRAIRRWKGILLYFSFRLTFWSIYAVKTSENCSNADTIDGIAISSVRYQWRFSAVVCCIFKCHGVNEMGIKLFRDGSRAKYLSNAASQVWIACVSSKKAGSARMEYFSQNSIFPNRLWWEYTIA